MERARESTQFLTLTEYQTNRAVPLSIQERDDLRRVASSVAITPSVGQEGCYDLTPCSLVGAIHLDTLSIEIRPKLPISRVLFLLSYALDPRDWQQTLFDFGKEHSLLEAVILGFVMHVRRAFQRGILQGYRTEEAALMTVRGRLRFDDQIRERFGIFPPAEVRYDEFTPDIEENRLVKAAIARLRRMRIRSDAVRKSLRAFDSVLGTVRLVHYDPRQLPDIHYTRLNEHYRPAVGLAKFILRSMSFEHRHGEVRASAFLVDMNAVVENFVVVALREALRVSEGTFPQGAKNKRLFLDHDESIPLKPDLSWWDGNRCTFVGDVKYKQLDASGIQHADLYQLLSYTIATDLPGGLLIYAAGEAEAATHRVVHIGKQLDVATIDLRGSPEEILGQVATVAHRIRCLRQGDKHDAC